MHGGGFRRQAAVVRCPTGSAVYTGDPAGEPLGRLHVRHVLHAVGPDFSGLPQRPENEEGGGGGGDSDGELQRKLGQLRTAYAAVVKVRPARTSWHRPRSQTLNPKPKRCTTADNESCC